MKDYSFEINKEEELLNAFPERDRRKLVLPSRFVYPLRTEHYFSWTAPDGFYTFLVFKKPEWTSPRGAVFRGGKRHGPAPAGMCDWCYSFGSSDEIGLLLTAVTADKSVGMNLCRDLTCIEKTETIALIAGKDFDQLAQKVCESIGMFFDQILKAPEAKH